MNGETFCQLIWQRLYSKITIVLVETQYWGKIPQIARESDLIVLKLKEPDLDSAQTKPVSLQVTEVTPEIIEYIKQRIIEAIRPQQIVLFGSYARNDTRERSDLDLLVVHDTSKTDREIRRQLDQLFLKRRFGLDLIVRTPEEVALNLADGNPFYTKHIFGQGVVLYERKG